MRNVICQCIINVTVRRNISIIDRQMMNSVTGFLSIDFVDSIPYIPCVCGNITVVQGKHSI